MNRYCRHFLTISGALSISVLLILVGCASTIKKAEKLFTPSVKSEKEMGREFAREASRKLPLIQNPDIVEYVHKLGKPLVKAAQPIAYRFRFHVIKNPTLNAFAVPGGHLYLYSGLILKTKSIHELAGVMAHELAHVKHRHSAQMIGKGTLVNLVSLAAIMAARGQQAATMGALGAAAAYQLSFVRQFEREADRSGLFYMYSAQYDPRGFMDFFYTMGKQRQFSTSEVPAYLLTHPVTEERMINVERLIRVHRLEVANPREEPDFYRFQGILMAETGLGTQVIPILKREVEEHPDDARRWHQMGIAYDHYGWTKEALEALERALRLEPNLAPAWMDLGYLQARMRMWSEAEASFKRAINIRPNYAEVYVAWGEMLVTREQYEEAVGLFRKALSLEPNLIRVHELMAKVMKQRKDDGLFHLEMASFHDKMDQSDQAIRHLNEALKIYGEDSERGLDIARRIKVIKTS